MCAEAVSDRSVMLAVPAQVTFSDQTEEKKRGGVGCVLKFWDLLRQCFREEEKGRHTHT